jgi:hypothetical protein
MQAYEKETLQMFDETVDDEPVFMCFKNSNKES